MKINISGKWLSSSANAILSKQLLDLALEKTDLPNNFDQIVVAVDPAVTVHKDSDATGIAVCGKSKGHYYLLHVEEDKFSPNKWSERVHDLYNKYNANFIVYESNQGR